MSVKNESTKGNEVLKGGAWKGISLMMYNKNFNSNNKITNTVYRIGGEM